MHTNFVLSLAAAALAFAAVYVVRRWGLDRTRQMPSPAEKPRDQSAAPPVIENG